MNYQIENQNVIHSSVMPDEVITYLDLKPNGFYLDATLGMGGHSELILSTRPDVKVFGIDQDREALREATKRLERFEDRFEYAHANFSELEELAPLEEVEFDGVFADLGVSSLQLDRGERGFSFRFDAPLDMRMNPDSDSQTAAELLASLKQEDIADLIYKYGEERFSRRIARNIVKARESGKPIETTKALADLVRRSVPRRRKESTHPATRTFQALRIAINRELDILEPFIRTAVDKLKPGGRLVLLTFHSLEDRIAKRTIRNLAGTCYCPPRLPLCICGKQDLLKVITKRPVTPGERELTNNPRSRSAKLRAAEKTG